MEVEHWRVLAGPADLPESERVGRALDAPLGAPPLRECAAGARRVCILVSGKDRRAGAHVYLPAILDRLAAAGVADDGIEIVCATGTHARHSAEEVRELVGDEVARRVRFRAHDCDRPDAFADLGRTRLGTPLLLDREVVEADLRILTGRITHHYFAGFSGGRKSILPGVAARKTIEANHRRVLDFSSGCRVHPRVFGGNLVGNPVHEDMVEAARRLGPSFVVNTLLDAEPRISHVFAGELEEAHQAGCREAERLHTFAPAKPAPVVVASAGGYPADINFIQSVKTIFNHRDAVRPGGVFVLVAEAAGGILSGMKDWMGWADRATLGAAMEARYNLAAHNSLMLRDVLDGIHVVLVSRLPAAEVRALGLLAARDLAEGLHMAFPLTGPPPSRIRIIHHGNVTHSSLRSGLIGTRGAESAMERRAV